LDAFVAGAEGRYLVDEVNAVFVFHIGERNTLKFLIDLKEGRVEVDDTYEPDVLVKLNDWKEFNEFLKTGKGSDDRNPCEGNADAVKRLLAVKLPEFNPNKPQPSP
jgi:hypothetical protein